MRDQANREALNTAARYVERELNKANVPYWDDAASDPIKAEMYSYVGAGTEHHELVEYDHFIPLPRYILSLYRKVHNASYMGLLPELSRAWITIDNRLYLWNYESPEQYSEYDGLDDSDVVVSVSLSCPKSGVFLDTIEYILVVATLSEVSLFAVTKDSQKLLRTACSVPCDGIIYKTIGSQCGRIFLAGSDGSLAEMVYTTEQSLWDMLSFGAGGETDSKGSARADFCRLIKRGYWNSPSMRFVPSFIRPPEATMELRDALADITVDNFRQILYCVSGLGNLSAFYLSGRGVRGGRGGGAFHRIGGSGKSFGIINMAKEWLGIRLGLLDDRGQRKSPSTAPSTTKEGNADSTALSDEERYLLRCFNPVSSSTSLRIVGVHPVSVLESRSVHVVCTINTGTRLLLQLCNADGSTFDSFVDLRVPAKVQIVGVCPPPIASHDKTGRDSYESIDGFFHRTLSANGVYLASYVATRSNHSELLCSVLSNRITTSTNTNQQHVHLAAESPYGEEKGQADIDGVNRIKGKDKGGNQTHKEKQKEELAGPVPPRCHSVLRDIREDSSGIMATEASWRMHLALCTSNAPLWQGDTSPLEFDQVISLTNALLPASKIALMNDTLMPSSFRKAGALFSASEMLTQCLARPTPTAARRFLCLDSQGLHVLVKQRPIDRVRGILMSCLPLRVKHERDSSTSAHDNYAGHSGRKGRAFGFKDDFIDDQTVHNTDVRAVRELIAQYGETEFVCMVVALCCGLPEDTRLSSFAKSADPSSGSLCPTEQNREDPKRFREVVLPSFLVTTKELRSASLENGEKFMASAVSEGLCLFLSRQLQALWKQPILNIEGTDLNSFWSEDVLRCTMEPLARLQTFMEEFLPQSRSTVPRTASQREDLLRHHAEYLTQYPSAQNSIDSASQQHSALHIHAAYGTSNVIKELEYSFIASIYSLVSHTRQVLHLLLVITEWRRHQNAILDSLESRVRDVSARASEEGIIGAQSMELVLRRDKTIRSVARKRRCLQAFQWNCLASGEQDPLQSTALPTLSSVVCIENHSQLFSLVLREGLHELCRVEQSALGDNDEVVAIDKGYTSGSVSNSQHTQSLSLYSSDQSDASADTLASAFAEHGPSFFRQSDVHEFVAFKFLHADLSKALRRREKEATATIQDLNPKIASHLLAASSSWASLHLVKDTNGSSIASLLGQHVAMLSEIATDDALELIVQVCLSAAQNFTSFHRDDLDRTIDRTDPRSAATETDEGALACYAHLVTSVCTIPGISLQQRAGMLVLAIDGAVSGTDTALLETICDGLRGRYTEDLLLNLPHEYVGDYLARKDKSLLFDWLIRKEDYVQATALKLEQAFEDNGTAIAARVGFLRQALSVVPQEEYTVVERMLKFALIQQDAYLRLLLMNDRADETPPFSFVIATSANSPVVLRGGGLSGVPKDSQHHYQDVSPDRMAHTGRRRANFDNGYSNEDRYHADSNTASTPISGKNKSPRSSPSPRQGQEDGPDNLDSPGSLIRARDHMRALDHAKYRLGFTLVSEGEWYAECFALTRDLNLWEANLCLLVLLDAENIVGMGVTAANTNIEAETLIIRLWKSFIYRLVPTQSKAGSGSQVSQFLSRQRDPAEIDIDPHDQRKKGYFEDYMEWLPHLREAIQTLCIKIESAASSDGSYMLEDGTTSTLPSSEVSHERETSHASLPLAPLLAELEAMASILDTCQSDSQHASSGAVSQHGTLRGWVPDALLAVNIRIIHIVRAYVHLFWSIGRAFSPEKIIKLLESFSYVLLTWIRDSAADTSIGPSINAQDLRGAIRSQEVDSWIDTLRHQLSDMSGRTLGDHSRAVLGRVHVEFQQILRGVDELAFH